MKKPQKAYSARSQKSWRDQWDLEEELAERQPVISTTEARIADVKHRIECWTTTLADGGFVHGDNIPDALRELEAEKGVLAAAKKQCASFRSKIHALTHPSRSQATKRRSQQALLAKLVGERLKVDRAIGSVVDNLRTLLQSREALSARMRTVAATIDFSTSDDDALDESRFDLLLDSLPTDVAAESERWAARLMGRDGQKKRAYTVLREQLTLPETLVSCHCYTEGDTIYLTEEQASRFLADKPWPSISPCPRRKQSAQLPDKREDVA